MKLVKISKRYFYTCVFPLIVIILTFSQIINAQNYDRIEKGRMKDILKNIKSDIKKTYYDPDFRGINIEERFDKAEKRLDEVENLGQAFAVIAQVLIDFDDSHLFFIPPATTVDINYGYRMQAIGDKVYVTSVKPKSSAEKKGLKSGDEILSLEGFKPNRKDLWKMNYFFNILNPKIKLNLKVIHAGSNKPEDIEFDSKIIKRKRVLDLNTSLDLYDLIRQSEDSDSKFFSYTRKFGNTVIWKLKTFSFDPDKVDTIMNGEINNSKNLIIDLRGNGGGFVKNLEAISGYLFDKEMKIADRKGRDDKKKINEPMMTKTQGNKGFTGRLIILIDSQSASASEILARFVQLEERGVVLGDISAGAVMQAVSRGGKTGNEREIFYGASITNADVIMSDGKSIENLGVVPNLIINPSALDLSKGNDPVLAKALQLFDNEITPEQAGKIFPDDEWDND